MMKTRYLSILLFCFMIGVLHVEINVGGLCNPTTDGLPSASLNVNSHYAQNNLLEVLKTESHYLILRFRLPKLKIQQVQQNGQTFTQIQFPGANSTTEIGKPKLPTYAAQVGLPSSSSVSTTVINKQSTFKRLEYPLITYQAIDPFFPDAYQEDVPASEFNGSTGTYNSPLYPAEMVQVVPVGFVRSQRIGALHVHPIQYNSATQQIKITEDITFRIDFFGASKSALTPTTSVLSDSPAYEDLFQSMLINNTQARSWRQGLDRMHTKGIQAAPSAPTPTRRRFKISILRNEMYRITYNNLRSAGVTPEDIDFDTVLVETRGSKQGYYIFDNNQNETFDSGDMIVFYARGLVNKFTERNIYIFSFSNKGTKLTEEIGDTFRISTRSVVPVATDIIPPLAFKTRIRFEENVHHDPLDGNDANVKSDYVDHYFWTGLRGDGSDIRTKKFSIEFPKAVSRENNKFNRDATLRVRLQGAWRRNAAKHKAVIAFNNEQLGQVAEWTRQQAPIVTRDFPQRKIDPTTTNELRIEANDSNNTPPGEYDFYIDWYEFDYWHTFRADSNRLEFNSDTEPEIEGKAHYKITNFSSETIDVYAVSRSSGLTEKLTDGLVTPTNNGYQILFEDDVKRLTNYFAVSNNAYKSIGVLTEIPPSTLRNPTIQADYIIITHKTFLDGVQPLVDFRRSQGLTVKVVEMDEIYNEFGFGLFNPFAIQFFLRYTYHSWQSPAPTYVLLVGDAHYDYKEVIVERYHGNYDLYPNFVPTYHGWAPESGETAMDQRFVNVSGDDSLPDMFIGRLSVQTESDLDSMVKKIIDYEQNPKVGPWQGTIVQVADDNLDNPSDDIFEKTRNRLIQEIIPIGYNTIPIYLRLVDSVNKTEKTRALIKKGFNDGALIVEYAGHGGISTWADEGIFRLQDAVALRNRYLPFVITTTCLNGQFDKPQEFGKHCLSEEFLHGKYGAIASLSASRLTYAQANAEFDDDLFLAMFVREPFEAKQGVTEIASIPSTIGKIVNDAKISFISRENNYRYTLGTEQYILFGDPATRLAVPNLDIRTKLEAFALNSDNQVVILNNDVGVYDNKGTWWKADGFDTENFFATAVFQNHFDSVLGNEVPQRTRSKIWKGEYGTIRLDIPPKSLPGRGVVRLFAYDDKRAAIGGGEFWVDTPIIGDVQDELDAINTHSLNVQVLVYDDQGGAKGINSIEVLWYDTVNPQNKSVPMVKISPPPGTNEVLPGGQWYGIQTPIPLPRGSFKIKYRIIITDTAGIKVYYPSSTERISVDVPKGPNISISADGSSTVPIRYTFDEKTEKYVLTAELINNGGRTVKDDFEVIFAEGNPDKSNVLIVAEDAEILGTVTVEPDEWENGDTVLQRTTVKLQLAKSLETGVHDVYVMVDPEVDTEDDIKGNVAEPNEYDNKLHITFVVNEFYYEQSKPLSAFSLDRVFDIDFPTSSAEVKGDRVPLTVSSSDPYGLTQPSLSFATIPRIAAVRRGLLRTGDEYAQQYEVSFRAADVTLKKPVTLKLRFDNTSLVDIVRQNTPWREGSKDFRASIIEESEKLGIYQWHPTYEKWKRLPSQVSYVAENGQPNPEEEGPIFKLENYITPIQTENANKQTLSVEDIKIDPLQTPAGTWVILFLDPTQFDVYLKKKYSTLYEKFEKRGELDHPFREENIGIEFTIPSKWDPPPELDNGTPPVPFEFGDILVFETDFSKQLAVLTESRNQNVGNGTATVKARIGPRQEFAIGDWFLFFTSKQYYELRDGTGSQIYLTNETLAGEKVNEELYVSDLGFEILVSPSSEEFQFGDKIKFSTAQVAAITAEATELTPFTLLSSDDDKPPEFNLWVDGVQPQAGSVIAPRPHISILLEDVNGVNLDTLVIRRGDNGKPLKPISDYTLRNPKDVNTVPIDYKPILFPGEYAFEIEAIDFNDNAIGGKERIFKTRFTVVDMPDVSPPVIEILVNDDLLEAADASSTDIDKNRLTEQPYCEIRVTDETALDNSLLNITFNQISADGTDSETTIRYHEFDEANWDFDEDDPGTANFSFAPNLENGIYRLRVTATDTSENTTEYETIFTLDEAVNLSEVFNVPNPTEDGKTHFTYQLLQPPDKVTIKIYTVNGRLIKTIPEASAERGANETFWDGRDEIGVRCANGVYLYRVIAHTNKGSVEKIGKLAILR